jgi:hypothetical protein
LVRGRKCSASSRSPAPTTAATVGSCRGRRRGAIALLLWRTQSRRWLIAATVAGGAGLATTVYDRIDIEGTEGIDLGRFVDPGWGLYVAMIGSASLAAAAGRLVAHV